jgi:MinD-like ATPase involved in chromosome partitioning or flagellar assembly
MSDQADKLRRLTKDACGEPCAEPAPLPMVVVAGARNGVGGTTVAVNLAAAIADRGARVLVVDAAEGGNDVADMAGVARTIEHCVSDIMNGKCGARDAIVDGPMGLRVLANRGRVASRRDREFRRNSPTGGENSRAGLQRLLSSIDSLSDEVDLVVVDAGCGLTAWTRRFWLRAQCVVLVTSADDASVMDTYAAVKASAAVGIRPVIRLLVNREVNGAAAEDAQRRVQKACRKFLSLSIDALPALPLHDGDFAAGASRGPRVWEEPNSAFARATLWLGRAVGDVLAGDTVKDVETFGRDTRAQRDEALAQQVSRPNPIEMFMQATDRIATY